MFVAFISAALAGGSVSPAPPAAPTVDFSSLPSSADVQPKNPDGKDHPVHARLIADRTSVSPGETVRVGLHLTQMPEWHTYWKSPGEIGLPTTIEWSVGPANVGDYQYPSPQRFDVDELVSFGYNDEVMLFSELTVPEGTPLGQIEVGASADWLVCKSSCIPGSASLTLPLQVTEEESKPTPWAALFDHYAQQHPQSAVGLEGYTAEIVLSADAVVPEAPFKAAIIVHGPSKVEVSADYFPFAPIVGDGWMIDDTKVGHLGDDLVVQIDAETLLDEAPDSDVIGGLFVLNIDGEAVPFEVSQPLPWKASGAIPATHPALTSELTPLPSQKVAHPPEAENHPSPSDVVPSTPAVATPVTTPDAGFGAIGNLLLAFVGGLLLNIMPCVLPVLTLKLYSLIEQTDITPGEQRTAGLAYTAGILASFLGLGLTIVLLRSLFGMDVDWGFQFQYPPYVAALVTIVFAFGLSLFGVFEIPAFGVSAASDAGAKEGPVGYFFTGVFATLLATPCSAPFLGTAIAFALSASTPMLLGIFGLVGLGLAAPFLLIAFVPVLYRALPRPGPWMETFKQLLGFTLIATAIWLLGVLGAQTGMDRMLGFVAFLGFVSAGCWIFGHFGGVAASGGRQLAAAVAGASLIAFGGYFYIDLAFAEELDCDDGTVSTALSFEEHIPWQPFSAARVAQLEGKNVFVDFTAEWCLTCKVNERTVLETSSVRAAMAKNNVVPLKADWTRKNTEITEWLHRYGKAGVPFYLVIPPTGDPIPLGEVITPGSVIAAISTK